METTREGVLRDMHQSAGSKSAMAPSLSYAVLPRARTENNRMRHQMEKSSFGFGMVSAMLLLIIVGLLTTWIGVALTDHGRRISRLRKYRLTLRSREA